VTFPGPVYGKDKRDLYATSSLFILPTHSENFGVVVAEALAAGCPAIVTHGAPWSGLLNNQCGWWVKPSVDALTAALEDALSQPTERLTQMGQRGRDWMRRDFSWERVAQDMSTAYEWIRGQGPVPSFIEVAA
jgi:glycosyltransferase involved in cell wall biosynthesis